MTQFSSRKSNLLRQKGITPQMKHLLQPKIWTRLKSTFPIIIGIVLSSYSFAQPGKGYVTDIEETTVDNEDFRRVLFTGPHSQLVVMSLKAGEDIGKETHKVDQFFRIEQGTGILTMDGKDYKVRTNSAFIVPAGIEHNLRNIGDEELKLYTIYSPSQHPPGTIQQTKADALKAESKQG